MDGFDPQAAGSLLDDARQHRVLAYNDTLMVLKAQPLQPGSDPADAFVRLYRTLLSAHEHVRTGEWPEDSSVPDEDRIAAAQRRR